MRDAGSCSAGRLAFAGPELLRAQDPLLGHPASSRVGPDKLYPQALTPGEAFEKITSDWVKFYMEVNPKHVKFKN